MVETFEVEPFLVEPGWTDSVYVTHLLGPSYRLLFYPDGSVRFEHRCDRGDRGTIICAPALTPEHSVDRGVNRAQRNTVTVSPSIVCPDCGTHGFVRESRWVPA
jgi:hypothetical protein